MKYGSVRTWSELCQRMFDSKLEARRGEELALLEKAGEIYDLEYQVTYILSGKPLARVKVVLDFRYKQTGYRPILDRLVVEDAKGVLTAVARVKYAWLKQLHGVDVILWRG